MSVYLKTHPKNPEMRFINRAAEVILNGGIIVYPTDTTYALGCNIGDKGALERIRRIRKLDESHYLTLLCNDLTSVSTYAKVSNSAFRILKANTPGPYTFILRATREVPRRLLNPKRKTIGLRIPDNRIAQALLQKLDAPIMTTSLLFPGDVEPFLDIEEIRSRIGKLVDLILDGGPNGQEHSTVVNLVGNVPEVVRFGKGDSRPFCD
jgi:tRNA threonylcarbamoyl adenosine modification protein (Sua5/YciO/YrdC/YwlC family)